MGKKKKNKRKQKKYNKNQFIDIVCKACDICRVFKPDFCYNIAYLADPDVFMREVYPRLLGRKHRFAGLNSAFIMQDLREIFCYSGICGSGRKMSCSESLNCFNAFTDQKRGVKVQDKRGKKRQQEPFVPAPYATFFISDDEAFKKEVKGILGDGNRDIEQDSSKGSAVSTG